MQSNVNAMLLLAEDRDENMIDTTSEILKAKGKRKELININ